MNEQSQENIMISCWEEIYNEMATLLLLFHPFFISLFCKQKNKAKGIKQNFQGHLSPAAHSTLQVLRNQNFPLLH